MSTPTEAPPVAETTPADNGGFVESLDSFFASMENPAPEPIAEPTPEPKETTPEPKETTPEPADKRADVLAELDSVEPKDWTPEAARRFKELKAELKTYRSRAEELEQVTAQKESRLQELEALANNPEYQQLQDRIAEYEKNMLVTKLEQSHAYQTLVEQPLANLVQEADNIAEKYSLDSNTLLEVIASNDEAAQEEQLSELLANASDRDKFRIYKIIEETKPILEQRRVLQEHAEAALREAEELDSVRNQQSLIERVQQRQEAANAVADKLKNKLTFLSGMEGVDLSAYAKEAAELDPSTLDPVTGTYQAMAAKLLPKMAAQYISLQTEIDSLTDRLAEYDRATPRAGGGSLATGGAPTAADGKSFLDAVTAAFGR
jgi:DNA repair exonuclease SbcCD ATPase subunit